MDEAARIALLRHLFEAEAPGIDVGIGDDAAVLAPVDGSCHRLVWTIDEQVEAVHFRRDLLSWHDLGWRSLMAAASDVAAMGAVPWCALSAMVLPSDVDDAALEQIGLGQRDAGRILSAPVVGGNLARGGALSIATTVLGTCERPVQRSGARVGDGLWLAGKLGIARAGLEALLRAEPEGAALAPALAAWRTPRALIAEGCAMAPCAHAAIDVSDGLACDVGHIAQASGVAIVLDEEALLADSTLCEAARALRESALDLALFGGEDYALVAASCVDVPGFRCIGTVRAGSGLVMRGPTGERAIEPIGFDHFRVKPGVTDRRPEASRSSGDRG
jgi:thiamine-monophosphate kinase